MRQLESAVVLHNQGELERAEVLYRRVLALDAYNFYALRFLGCLCRLKQEYAEGIQLLYQASTLNPNDADCLYNLGNILAECGRHRDAIKALTKSVELRTDFAEARQSLGWSLFEIGDYMQSEVELSRAISLDSSLFQSWLNLGNTLNIQKRYSEALDCYRQAIIIKPNFADAHLAIGLLFREQGQVDKAISSFRNAIEFDPDSVDAHFALGLVLKDQCEIGQARDIVATLADLIALKNDNTILFDKKKLVYNWYHRRLLGLSLDLDMMDDAWWQKYPSRLAAVKNIQSNSFPSLFLGDTYPSARDSHLTETGYLVQEDILSSDLCSELIDQYSDFDSSSWDLIQILSCRGILSSVLHSLYMHTGFPHLIWNCIYYAKSNNDRSLSDDWHYDNHYNIWTPKLMIYLNSQNQFGGATQFVDASLSRKVSETTDYIGLTWQRMSYASQVKMFAEELCLHPDTLDPKFYTFSPDHAGSGVWFYPSRTLHRGVSPKRGIRHVLSFSFTALPKECGWSVPQCVDQSITILQYNVLTGMQKIDINPFWLSPTVAQS